jgi:hypothetical protein
MPILDRNSKDLIELLEACNLLDESLEALFRDGFKPFLQEKSFKWVCSGVAKVPDTGALTAADMNQIMVVLNLWGCQLLLGFTADAVRSEVIRGLDEHLMSATDRRRVRESCEISMGYSNRSTLSDLAHAVLQYLPLCLRETASEFAASRTIFPLTNVFWQFRHSEEPLRQAGVSSSRQWWSFRCQFER